MLNLNVVDKYYYFKYLEGCVFSRGCVVIRVEYPCWTRKGDGPQKRIDAYTPVLGETTVVNNDSIYLWAHREFDPTRMILVDEAMADTLPGLRITPAARVRRPATQSAAEQGRGKR